MLQNAKLAYKWPTTTNTLAYTCIELIKGCNKIYDIGPWGSIHKIYSDNLTIILNWGRVGALARIDLFKMSYTLLQQGTP